MKLVDCLLKSSRDGFVAKTVRLKYEIKILRKQIDFLLMEETADEIMTISIYESAVIRTAKLTRNSGFTIPGMIEYARRNTIREFRKLVYPVLDSLEKAGLANLYELEKIKHCRDRLIVHIDPRFAFDKEKTSENTVSQNQLKSVLELILMFEKVLFDVDIL